MPDTCTIELRMREANHLFDPLDASSPTERDLNFRVEEFIVESMKELDAKKACEIVLHFDNRGRLPMKSRSSRMRYAVILHAEQKFCN